MAVPAPGSAALTARLRPALARPSRRTPAGVRRSPPAARASDDDGPNKGRDLYVPELIFQGITPEQKAANALVNLFTFVATRIVLEQMSGNRHRSPVYTDVVEYMQENPLTDSEAWLEGLMNSENMDLKLTALRIIETREAYVETYFSFANMKSHSVNAVKEQTKSLKAGYLMSSFAASGTDGTPAAPDEQ